MYRHKTETFNTRVSEVSEESETFNLSQWVSEDYKARKAARADKRNRDKEKNRRYFED